MDNELYSQLFSVEDIHIQKRKRWIITAIITLFVILLGISGYFIWYKFTYSATLSLLYTPTSATATLNGKVIKAGITKIKPGKYTVTIQKKGFASYSSTINMGANQTNTIAQALLSNDPTTANWYNTHPEDQKINETIGATKANTAIENLQNDFPVASVLPLDGPTYAINYGASPDKKGHFAMFLTYYGDTGKQDALQALQSLGYNPNDYEIIYTDGDSQ